MEKWLWFKINNVNKLDKLVIKNSKKYISRQASDIAIVVSNNEDKRDAHLVIDNVEGIPCNKNGEIINAIGEYMLFNIYKESTDNSNNLIFSEFKYLGIIITNTISKTINQDHYNTTDIESDLSDNLILWYKDNDDNWGTDSNDLLIEDVLFIDVNGESLNGYVSINVGNSSYDVPFVCLVVLMNLYFIIRVGNEFR